MSGLYILGFLVLAGSCAYLLLAIRRASGTASDGENDPVLRELLAALDDLEHRAAQIPEAEFQNRKMELELALKPFLDKPPPHHPRPTSCPGMGLLPTPKNTR